jgi:predicted RNA binding protein YcfA (HicA-like mRNA interferase family)
VSPALPVVSGADPIRLPTQAGFEQSGQRGSHVKLRHANGRVVIVPLHNELARGTLRPILRQAGLSAEEFAALM